MGLSVSKRVKNSLSNSPEFGSACDSSFSHCLSLTQRAFPHVFPYQLASASDHLYQTLIPSRNRRPVLKWIKSPPTRSQVDSALRAVTRDPQDDQTLDSVRFKEWAVELFAVAVLSGAGKELAFQIPVSAAVIAGVGAVTRPNNGLVGAGIGLYALAVSSAIYLSL